MTNPKLIKWEKPLLDILNEVDIQLEAEFAGSYPRHPARPPHGATANPQSDGLFRITANFTAGFGSDHGKGYALKVDFVTLQPLAAEQTGRIKARALELIQNALDEKLPERALTIKRDRHGWKIVGDLSLDDR